MNTSKIVELLLSQLPCHRESGHLALRCDNAGMLARPIRFVDCLHDVIIYIHTLATRTPMVILTSLTSERLLSEQHLRLATHLAKTSFVSGARCLPPLPLSLAHARSRNTVWFTRLCPVCMAHGPDPPLQGLARETTAGAA